MRYLRRKAVPKGPGPAPSRRGPSGHCLGRAHRSIGPRPSSHGAGTRPRKRTSPGCGPPSRGERTALPARHRPGAAGWTVADSGANGNATPCRGPHRQGDRGRAPCPHSRGGSGCPVPCRLSPIPTAGGCGPWRAGRTTLRPGCGRCRRGHCPPAAVCPAPCRGSLARLAPIPFRVRPRSVASPAPCPRSRGCRRWSRSSGRPGCFGNPIRVRRPPLPSRFGASPGRSRPPDPWRPEPRRRRRARGDATRCRGRPPRPGGFSRCRRRARLDRPG